MRWAPARSSRSGRWLVVTGVILMLVIIGTVLASPAVFRHLLIARIQAITHRPVEIESAALNPFTGHLTVHALRLRDRDGTSAFVDFDRLDVRVRPLSLLAGHLWIRDVRLEGSTVRIVRSPEGLNIADLLEGSGGGHLFSDVTIDHLVVTRGATTLEDRALAEPRTWATEQIEIEAHNLSTRRDDGRAVARSMTVGAPVSLEMRRVRLYPIHLEADVTASNLDLSLARLYLPPDAALVLERGRASSTLHVALDARAGVRANATSQIEDVVLRRRDERDPSVLVPRLTVELSDLQYREDQLDIGRLEMAGQASVKDPTAGGQGRVELSTVHASLGDVTWPVIRPGRLDVQSSVPGGGVLRLAGSLSPPPAASQLRLQLSRVDLHPWARLVPGPYAVDGIAEADLRIEEPLAPAVPSHALGFVAVNHLRVAHTGTELARSRRVEVRDIEAQWPRFAARRLTIVGPRAMLVRDASGALMVPGAPDRGSESSAPAPSGEPSPLRVDVGEVVVNDGRLVWRDERVTPAVTLDFSGLTARVTGAAWPVRNTLGIRADVRPPGGGRVAFDGRVTVEPLAVQGRARAQSADIAPYVAYANLPARMLGRVDLDLGLDSTLGAQVHVTARGQATASGIDVRDGERTLLRVERADAADVNVEWPGRVTVGDVDLRRPWVLLERDRKGALSLRELLTPRNRPGAGAPSEREPASTDGAPFAVTVRRIRVEDGGARTVDQRVSPPFALDSSGLNGRVEGLSTDPAARPARVELTGRVGGDAQLAVRGTMGSLGGPLRLDMGAELHDFAVPRTNPYLLQQVAWEARSGSLTTTARLHIDGDTLDARTDILLKRLELERAAGSDEAQARIGLPLGTIVALMKDRRGDIHVTLPVSGRLSDPRFDVSDAIWSTVRNVAVKTITAPLSWIGRVQTGADSMIRRVDVDPVRFAPGSAQLGPDAQEQVARLAAFLDQVPDVRLALIPVVSPSDRAALPEKKLADLSSKRIDAVREGIKKAGIDGGRLKAEPPTDAEAAEGQIRLGLLEPEPARPGLFRRLLGPLAPNGRAG